MDWRRIHSRRPITIRLNERDEERIAIIAKQLADRAGEAKTEHWPTEDSVKVAEVAG